MRRSGKTASTSRPARHLIEGSLIHGGGDDRIDVESAIYLQFGYVGKHALSKTANGGNPLLPGRRPNLGLRGISHLNDNAWRLTPPHGIPHLVVHIGRRGGESGKPGEEREGAQTAKRQSDACQLHE